LWIIGVEYALFWGILAGFLAVIPYIGTLIGGILPFIYSLATADYSWQPGAVVVYYFIVQQIEGNIITPKIVGSDIDLNPLFSIFALIFFGSIWGIGGVILALPIMSIIRIVFDHIESTKALAMLMSSSISNHAQAFIDIADE
jgi:predicted PurR-regulated permease PerM